MVGIKSAVTMARNGDSVCHVGQLIDFSVEYFIIAYSNCWRHVVIEEKSLTVTIQYNHVVIIPRG